MNHRDRVLKTLNFEHTDHPPYDLMEGCVWSELLEYFNDTYGLRDMETVLDYLDTDFRWTFVNYQGPAPAKQEQTQLGNATYTKNVTSGPLSQANTIREVES